MRIGQNNPPKYESAITLTSKASINKFIKSIRRLVLGVRLDENRSKSMRPLWDTILVVLEINEFYGSLLKKPC